jgi:hypothetical protein
MKSAMNTTLASSEKLLRILCAALMLSLGFAHKPVNAALAAPALDEAYRLPDGTFAEICFGHAEGVLVVDGHSVPGHTDIAAALFCEACLLASSILIPAPDSGSWAKTEFAWLANALRSEQIFGSTIRIDRAKARAPPLSA